MKLLVIEDEVKLAEYLRRGLTEEGYVVDVAHNGVDGLHLAMEGDHHLLVLDVRTPQEYAEFVAKEQARWKDVIQRANIKID